MACKEEAATIKEVKGSNKILEYYDHPLQVGMERVGKGLSKWKFGLHSSNVGPLENECNGCEKSMSGTSKKFQPHRYKENRP